MYTIETLGIYTKDTLGIYTINILGIYTIDTLGTVQSTHMLVVEGPARYCGHYMLSKLLRTAGPTRGSDETVQLLQYAARARSLT
jgi:hypothetical protein